MRPREGEQLKMYQSPIKINTDTTWPDGIVKKAAMDVGQQTDEIIMKAVVKVGVEVDKEELIRALRFDRCQYQKGYSDGWAAADQSIVRCRECTNYYSCLDRYYCRVSGEEMFHDNYCSRGERREERDGQADG